MSRSEIGAESLHVAECLPRRALNLFVTPVAFGSVGLALVLFAAFRGPVILWSQGGTTLVPAGSIVLALGLALITLASFAGKVSAWQVFESPLAAVFGLLLVFTSDWLNFRFNLFQGPSVRGELFVAFLCLFVVLRSRLGGSIPWMLLLLPPFLFLSFRDEAAGRLIFSDDHTAVFYRLTLLLENFPHIPFFNPEWNGGFDARDFFATGILNFYFLFYPILRVFGPDASYTPLVGFVVFLLVPACSFLAARLSQLNLRQSVIAAALSMCSSLLWYRWCLKYGAMGFVVSTALLPLNIALAVRLLERRGVKLGEGAFFLATLTLMSFWSLSLACFVPVAAYALLFRRSAFESRSTWIFTAAFLALNVPWIAVFLDSSQVLGFLKVKAPSLEEQNQAAEQRAANEESGSAAVVPAPLPQASVHTANIVKGKAHRLTLKAVFKSVKNFATNSNPLILFLALSGILAMPGLASRRVLAMVSIWLILLGAVIAPAVPQLELERMLVILGVVLSVPAAAALDRLFLWANEGKTFAAAAAAVPFAFLCVGGPAVASVVRNRSLEKYYWKSSVVSDVATAINTKGGEGRVLFSGFVLHELEQGHLAPLAYWTNHPLVASSPFHNRWWYTNVVPASFMAKGPDGIEEYLELLNVTAVFAHEREWRKYFSSHPERYALVWMGGRFQMFQRRVDRPSYFLEGNGEVLSQSSHRVVVRLSGESAVLKFNYFPFLKADGCSISGSRHAPEIELIKLSGCRPGSTVTIEAVDALSRLRS